jgi:hypothetical protein
LNVDYQKLAFAQNVVTSNLVNATSTTTATHNTTAAIPGAGIIIHSILSVPMFGGAAFGFLVGFLIG